MTGFVGHTPGPWEWAFDDFLLQTETSFDVCEVRWISLPDRALIAAAPQLLVERDEARAENERLRVALHQIADLNLDDLQGPDAPDHLFDVVEHIATQALEEPL